MRPKPIIIFLLFAGISISLFAQNKNPYQSTGKTGKILTLSKGEYDEFFDSDSIQQIGNALVNINQMKVVKLLSDVDAKNRLDNTTTSRFLSVDPLTSSYPWYSPYQYAGNTPIQAIDLDGLEEYVVIKDLYKNGSPKSVSIYYVVQNDDVTKKVNHHFREVLGKNPDGTEILGDYLTDQNAIRIVRKNGTETVSPDASLSKQEQAIVDQRSTDNLPTNPDNKTWYLKTYKGKFTSEAERNTDITQDKVASKKFGYVPPKFDNKSLIPKIVLSNFNGSNNYYYGGSPMPMGGQLGNDLASALQTLAGQLRNAENIKSITVNLNQAINANAGSSQYNIAQQYGQAAVTNMVNLLQVQLKGSGIVVNAGTTTTTPNASAADLLSSGKSTGVNIQIQ